MLEGTELDGQECFSLPLVEPPIAMPTVFNILADNDPE